MRLLLRGPVASVVLASAYSLSSTLRTVTIAASGRLGQAPRHASAYVCFWKNFQSFVLALFAL